MEDRFNTPTTNVIELEAMGHRLRVTQDPNSKHVGTTVWDSSIVVLKYLERHSNKGEFSRAKLKGKRAIELGAGCGLAGLGFALLGCDVVLTDEALVLPLLFRNVTRLQSQAAMDAAADSFLGSVGSVEVAELWWGNAHHIAQAGPPFDAIVATDVVYVEDSVPALLATMLALSHPRTPILLGYEFRSATVHDRLHAYAKQMFDVKKVPATKLHAEYQHPSIDVFIMKRKAAPTLPPEVRTILEEVQFMMTNQGLPCVHITSLLDSTAKPGESPSKQHPEQGDKEEVPEEVVGKRDSSQEETTEEEDEEGRNGGGESEGDGVFARPSVDEFFPSPCGQDDQIFARKVHQETLARRGESEGGALPSSQENGSEEWEERRSGAMAARLLADVKVPSGSSG
ncbi:unnamed protein product [Closterium sp. NIES-65]|nr:unnamed protein product [Closterium sp. NIES-65]